uniref:Uncharacterized protein n=1 Tax=viral metagenome TaxID=1070528 RepID=A0A6M3KJE1_9ZZZZ
MWEAIFKAIASTLEKNSKKAVKGEKADATISPIDLVSAMVGGGGDSANIKGTTGDSLVKGNVPVAPADYYKTAQVGYQPNQYVPGPGGSVIGGQGEAMSGYGMKSPQARIPSAYQNFTNPNPQVNQQPINSTQRPDVGFMRGMINSLTSQPQPEGINDVSQGRKTAYYAGGVIPNVIMSKLGQPSSAEATAQQAQITGSKSELENRELTITEKQKQIELKNDLSKAAGLVSTLSPEQKNSLFTDLVTKYPDSPTEIRRILFPEEYYGKDQTGMNQLRQAIFSGR